MNDDGDEASNDDDDDDDDDDDYDNDDEEADNIDGVNAKIRELRFVRESPKITHRQPKSASEPGRPMHLMHHDTVGQNNQESRLQYWATCSSICSFARTAHSIACSALLVYSFCSRAPLRSLVRLLAHFTHSLPRGTVNDKMAIYPVFFSILDHSA